MPPLIENYEGSYSMWSTAESGRRDRVRAVGHGPRVPRHREVAHGIRVAPDRCSVDVEIHDAHAVVVGRSGLQQTEPWTVAPWFGLVNVTLGGASEAVTLTSNNIPSFSFELLPLSTFRSTIHRSFRPDPSLAGANASPDTWLKPGICERSIVCTNAPLFVISKILAVLRAPRSKVPRDGSEDRPSKSLPY